MAAVEAFLPFRPHFVSIILDGRKTKTARTKAYGAPGQILNTGFCRVRLIAVERVPLGEVERDHWRAEGLESPAHFRMVWGDIHPKRDYDPTQMVFLHTFEVVR